MKFTIYYLEYVQDIIHLASTSLIQFKNVKTVVRSIVSFLEKCSKYTEIQNSIVSSKTLPIIYGMFYFLEYNVFTNCRHDQDFS
jgi:hypothetical protein